MAGSIAFLGKEPALLETDPKPSGTGLSTPLGESILETLVALKDPDSHAAARDRLTEVSPGVVTLIEGLLGEESCSLLQVLLRLDPELPWAGEFESEAAEYRAVAAAVVEHYEPIPLGALAFVPLQRRTGKRKAAEALRSAQVAASEFDSHGELVEYWRRLEEAGWLEDTPTEEIPFLRSRLLAAYSENPANTHLGLSKLFFVEEPWLEDEGDRESVPDRLVRLSQATGGCLRFHSWDGPPATDKSDELALTLEGVQEALVLRRRWSAHQCATAINGLLDRHARGRAEGSIPGGSESRRLLFLPDGPNLRVRPIFVRRKTLDRARSLGVVPLFEQTHRAPMRISGGLSRVSSTRVAGAGVLSPRLLKGSGCIYAVVDRVEIVKVGLPNLERLWSVRVEEWEELEGEIGGVLLVTRILSEGSVRAFDAGTGELLWQRAGYAHALQGHVTWSSGRSKTEFLDPRTGRTLWSLADEKRRTPAPGGHGASPAERRLASLYESPVKLPTTKTLGHVGSLRISLSLTDAVLLARDWRTGKLAWETDATPLLASLGLSRPDSGIRLHSVDDRLQVLVFENRAVAVTLSCRRPYIEEVWRALSCVPLGHLPSPLVSRGRLYCVRKDWITALDIASGEVVFDLNHDALEGVEHWAPVVPLADQIAVGTHDGLACISAEVGSLTAAYNRASSPLALGEDTVAAASYKSIDIFRWT